MGQFRCGVRHSLLPKQTEERDRLSSNGHFSTAERILCTHLTGDMLVPVDHLNTLEKRSYLPLPGTEHFFCFLANRIVAILLSYLG
jgi:hypothetical protein